MPEIRTTARSERTSPARKRLVVIHNPTAGGRRRTRLQHTLEQLWGAGCDVTVMPTGGRGDAERFGVELSRRRPEAVVVAGGDGTINEVLNGLAGSSVPLAIIPMGTANVLASEIGLSLDPVEIARTIISGPAEPVCLGRANGRLFTAMVGAGFDAWVVHDVNLRLKRWIGKGAYVLESLRRFWLDPGGPYDVIIDGEHHRASSVVVCNGHYYAGRYVLAPQARLNDPTLHVCLFERPGRWNLLRYIVATLTNRAPNLADVHLVKGTHVEIHGGDEPVQGDGDTLCRLPVTVDIVSGGIELVMPRPL